MHSASWQKSIQPKLLRFFRQYAVTWYSNLIMYNFDVMNIQQLTQEMHRFITEKGWYEPGSARPQTPKNLAASLCIEAAEVLELFQWQEQTPDPDTLAGELADVTLYLLQLASVSEIDLEKAILEKLKQNYDRNWDQTPDERRSENDKED